MSREREASAAGLIAGTVPTKRSCGCAARRGASTRVEAVLQAMTTRSGAKSRDQTPDHFDDAIDEPRLAQGAVGKEGVVGRVDDFGVRPRLDDLCEHREAAETGIEHEYARPARRVGRGHGAQ